MKTQIAYTKTRCSGTNGGFTLIELIAVMTITAILAVVSVPALTSLSQTRAAGAAVDLHRSMTFARQHAVSTGTGTWVVFNVGGNNWSVLKEDPLAPGRAGASLMTDPSRGQDYVETLNSDTTAGVSLVSATFDAGSEIGFDWLGRPLNASENDLVAAGTVTLTGNHQVTVEAETGHIRYVAP